MSSPRAAIDSAAVVCHGPRAVGPMVVPPTDSESFVEEFNRTYRSIGLTVTINDQGRPLVSQPKGLHSAGATAAATSRA
ncbi:hypothetical protein [Allorhodopirellula solitaria]|uniref:Uncharacterized protein n=1 Tax=Allorhodopirellula solitaria TaxID=2527987 RepID=A0A5C5XQ96_9BACT|nr:hypothetical protein [Allorhodopirellula solitaria]TWT64573.1 hypothetical protein CA85_37060 [Allorhodopirellula solitaria]